VPVLARVLTAAFFRAITSPLSSGPKANTYFKDVVFAALRANLSAVTVGTEQWINGTTESVYLDFAKKERFQPDSTVLDSGLKLHWLGTKTAEKILLYFHGGGYVLASSPGHFQWLFDLQNDLAKTTSISVVVVSYTLAPHGQYPEQLKQAAESLSWLVDREGKKASNIFIGGDSAGGNMAMSLMSHLIRPHPQVSPIKLAEPLAGAILISPWTKFGTDDDSVKRNATSDMVTPTAANRWSSLFLGSSPQDNYNQPIFADVSWWKGLDLKVKDILVWGGGGEVLIDSIEASTKVLKEAHSRTELVVQPNAAHEDFIMDKLLGYKNKAQGTEVVENWIKARL